MLEDYWLWGRNWAAGSFDFSGPISLLNQAASGPSTKASFLECLYILLDSPHSPIHLLCLMILILREARSLLSLAPLPPPFGSDLVPHCVFAITGVYSSLNSIWSPEYYLLQSEMEAQVITKREAWVLCQGYLGLSDRTVASASWFPSLQGSPQSQQGERLALEDPLGLEIKLGTWGSFQQA